jgi:HK97 family phage portal protein
MASLLSTIRLKAAQMLLGGEFVFRNGQFERYWGGQPTLAGIAVTPESSLQTVTVMRCVSLIAGIASTLPVDVYRVTATGRQHVKGDPIERLLDVEPNPSMTAATFRFTLWAHYLLWGNAFARKVVIGNRLVALWPMMPWAVEVFVDSNGDNRYRYTDPATGQQDTYSADEVLHVLNFTLDGLTGLSVIQKNALAVASSQASERTAATSFRLGTMSSYGVEISQALDDKQRKAIQKAWIENNAGWDKAGSPPIIEGGGKIVPLPLPLRDIQFLEQRQFTDEQICIMFGVPPPMVGIMSKSSSWASSTEALKQSFLDFTLGSMLKGHEAAYDRSLIQRDSYYIKHNTGAYLRANMRERYETYRIGILSGILSPNKCLEMEDMDPYEGGDVHLTQQQNIPVGMAGDHIAKGESDGSTPSV